MGCATSYLAASSEHSSHELSSFSKTSSQTRARNLPSPPTWCRIGNTRVALKLLHDSQEITKDFLNDMKKYYQYLRTFILTKYYNNNNDLLTWNEKINILKSIAEVIKSLHNEKSLQGENLFHGNLHPGNLLKNSSSELKNQTEESILIGDLGCWIPSNVLKNSQKYLQPSSSSYNYNNNYLIHGVLPYIAPEILRGEKKSQASDIYNFGMIMWELSTFSLPYFDRAHNLELALDICEGARPDPLPTTPEFYFDLMERCWDDDPSLRPNAIEIIRILDMNQLYLKYSEQTMKVVQHQECSNTKNKLSMISQKITKKVVKTNKNVIRVGSLRGVMKKKFQSKKEELLTTNIHPEAYYTSRVLDFSFNRLSISSNSNNSFTAGNTSTSDDFGEETGQSSFAISDIGLEDVIEDFIILAKDSKGKERAWA
ncbi:1411_t:CDS:2 [Funneliformis geosporum]|uniref:1411_t:CDS:1 n=1 Tax=Funneliformis geosporum TaxID=1117311 RepID=A0A9W4SH34_9GLOM|nr:1411_t:CDS:2 [Funneliformis geosporum]